MIGGYNVPFGKLWRTGANEPTMLHFGPITLAGVKLEAGTYSLYTIPDKEEWTIIINRSTTQWGDEGSVPERHQEGRGRPRHLPVKAMENHVEQFTIRPEVKGSWGALVLEWEKTKGRCSAGNNGRKDSQAHSRRKDAPASPVRLFVYALS
jgi:hypothetical protein